MTSEQIYLRILHFLKIATSAVCSVTNKKWISNNAIALIALLVSVWSAWETSAVVQHQRQETTLTMARQVTVTLRRFDPDVDPFIWGGPESRELMKDKFITMQVFNDGDAELQDVDMELLVVKLGAWTLLGQQKVDRLAPHTQSSAVVSGAAHYDPLPLAKGRVTFTDGHGNRWVRWSDGRLLAK